jgi:hypothetical protein
VYKFINRQSLEEIIFEIISVGFNRITDYTVFLGGGGAEHFSKVRGLFGLRL